MGSVNELLNYFATYGLWFLFIIVYLEYLNLPGLPAGIIMPAVGALVAHSQYSFIFVFFLSVLAGILGSLTLYTVGYYIGHPAIEWIYNKFPKSRKSIDKVVGYSEKYGEKGVLICRVIPVARTLISLVSGTFRSRVLTFTIYSGLGICVWNFTTIMAGYLATLAIIKY